MSEGWGNDELDIDLDEVEGDMLETQGEVKTHQNKA